jgi:hypothetical protein
MLGVARMKSVLPLRRFRDRGRVRTMRKRARDSEQSGVPALLFGGQQSQIKWILAKSGARFSVRIRTAWESLPASDSPAV